jgi:hypothetical protein
MVEPDPGKLLVNLIYSPTAQLVKFLEQVGDDFGVIDCTSREFSFTETDYYEKEMGADLRRRLVCFKQMVGRDGLVRLKLLAQDMEESFSNGRGQRTINADPGLLTLENFVLASGKNYSHRVYLGQGVFAEVTLVFKQGSFRSLAWTYPFYRRPEVISFLNRVRERYRWQLRIHTD